MKGACNVLLIIAGYISFAFSVIGFALSAGDNYLLSPAITMAISGTVFVAFNKGLSMRVEVRDGIRDLSPEVQARKEAGKKLANHL